MAGHAVPTRVQLTGRLERTDGGPRRSGHCLRVAARPEAPADDPWFLDSRGYEIRHEAYHHQWPTALRPVPGERLEETLCRLVGQVLKVTGILLTPPCERPLVSVHKVQVAGLPGRGVGLDTLWVQPRVG